MLPKFKKSRREKEKKLERERRGISAKLLLKFLCPNSCSSPCVLCAQVWSAKKKKQLRQCHCRNREKKRKFFFGNCGNGIAENGGKKLNGIVAMSLPKMRGKKNVVAEIWKEILKKVLRSQYFYNAFTTNHR